MEALTRPARTLLVVGRWLVPWAGVLVVSSALALAVDRGLTRARPDVPAPPPIVAAPAPAGSAATSHPDRATPVGAQWVLLVSTQADGAPLAVHCLVAKDQGVADTLEVSRDDLAQIVLNLCTAWSS